MYILVPSLTSCRGRVGRSVGHRRCVVENLFATCPVWTAVKEAPTAAWLAGLPGPGSCRWSVLSLALSVSQRCWLAQWLALILAPGGRTVDLEPPTGFEPVTYALREARRTALGTLPAQIAALASRNALNAQLRQL